MAERLTREQMAEKYPNQWLGINNIEYNDSSKKEIKSVNVVYTDKTASELGLMALHGDNIQPYFTTPDDTFQLGFIGAQ